MNFPLLDESNAPQASLQWLAQAKENFGMIPNVEKVMALSPQLLAGYTFMWEQFDTTSLTAIERQVVYLTANYENECSYCVPWHSILAKQLGMSKDDLLALRNGGKIANAKLNELSNFTRGLLANRGKVSETQLQIFLDAGYTDAQVLEVILGLAIKLISNYTNSVAGTPLDSEAESERWHKPLIEERKIAIE
ncbi:carboxymuconolactone decarboxylase [Colwellia sp. 39_35_sub15_T18]|nr:carboxymuconolactone decarboxylase [Colwellia sp. 39_35_sub15_T18]